MAKTSKLRFAGVLILKFPIPSLVEVAKLMAVSLPPNRVVTPFPTMTSPSTSLPHTAVAPATPSLEWASRLHQGLSAKQASALLNEADALLPALAPQPSTLPPQAVQAPGGVLAIYGQPLSVEVDTTGKIQPVVQEGPNQYRRLLVTTRQLLENGWNPNNPEQQPGLSIIPDGHKNNMPTEQRDWLDGEWPPPQSSYAPSARYLNSDAAQVGNRAVFIDHAPLVSNAGVPFGLQSREAVALEGNRLIWVTEVMPTSRAVNPWGAMQVLPFALSNRPGESLIVFPAAPGDWARAEGLQPGRNGRFQAFSSSLTLLDPAAYHEGEPMKWLGSPGARSWAMIAHKGSPNLYLMRWVISHPNTNSSFDAFCLDGPGQVYAELEPKAEARGPGQPTLILTTIEALPVKQLLPEETVLGQNAPIREDLQRIAPALQARLGA